MMMKSSVVRLGWHVVAAALAIFPVAAAAQDGAVAVVKSDEGALGAFAAEGVWVQRIVVVRNTGRQDLDVKVDCLADAERKGKRSFSRVVALPAGTQRRVELAARPGRMGPWLVGGVRPDPNAPPSRYDSLEERYAVWDVRTQERLVGGNGPVARVLMEEINLSVIRGEEEPAESWAYLKDNKDESLRDFRLLGNPPHRYATRWYGYSMVHILALTDPVLSRISPSQTQALLDWVRRGGVLVLAGAKRLPEALAGELGEAAGTAAVGVHYFTRMQVTGVGDANFIEWKTPIPMAELLPSSAEVLHECNGLPLLTRQALGDGWVFTLATPLTALQLGPLPKVWTTIRKALSDWPPVRSDQFLRTDASREALEAYAEAQSSRLGDLSPGERPGAAALLEDIRFSAAPAAAVLRSLSGRRAPPRWVPVAVLTAMAGLALVGGLILRFRRRGELLWLLLAPGAVALAGAFYAVGLARTDPERLSFVGLITALGDGRTRVQEVYGYYSGSHSRTLNFSAGCENGLIMDVGQVQGGALASSETRTGREVFLPEQPVGVNGDKAVYVDGVVSGPALQPVFTFDAQGLAGTIRNDLGFDLSDAVIYVNGRTYRLGGVPKGESSASVTPGKRLGAVDFVSLSPEPQAVFQARGEFTPSLARTDVDILRNRLLGALVAAPVRTPMPMPARTTVREWPVLIGYGAQNLLDPLKDHPAPRQGWSVVVWPVRIEPPKSGSAVIIPSGLARVQYRLSAAGLVSGESRSVLSKDDRGIQADGNGVYRVEVRVTLPESVGGLRDATARLKVRASARHYRLTVLGRVAGTGALKPVAGAERDRPLGLATVDVPSAEQFATPGGTYVFVLEFRRLRGGDGDENLLIGNTFEGADVDLEGTTR